MEKCPIWAVQIAARQLGSELSTEFGLITTLFKLSLRQLRVIHWVRPPEKFWAWKCDYE